MIDMNDLLRRVDSGCGVATNGHETRNGAHAEAEAEAPRAVDLGRIQRAVRELLLAIGEDPQRDGLRDTPKRVARAYQEMFRGLGEDPARHLGRTFRESCDQIVLVRDVPFASVCEHHLLPFRGRAHIAYLPADGRIVGLSKLARTLDGFARRPQVQERLGEQLVDALMSRLAPRGACVMLSAEHLCMSLRGACKPGSETVTFVARGCFQLDSAARAEVLALIRG